MINNKMLILVLIVILAIVSIVAFSISNNVNDNRDIVDNNGTIVAKNNNSTLVSNGSQNDLNNEKLYVSKEIDSKNQKNVKHPKSKLKSKNEAIEETKLNLKNASIDYLDVGGAKLVKSEGNQYWAVSFIESDGRPGLMYIDSKKN